MSFPARTMDGADIEIVSDRTDDRRGVIYTGSNGIDYVCDAATGLMLTLDQAPLTGEPDLALIEEARAVKFTRQIG